MERTSVSPWAWGQYAGIVQANNLHQPERILFVSGQCSVDENGSPVHAGDMAAQINKSLDNLDTILEAAGFSLADAVQINVFTTDMPAYLASFQNVKSRIAEKGHWAAGTLVGVTALSFPELLVAFEVVAVK